MRFGSVAIVAIDKTNYMPGLGECLDIRYTRADIEFKRFVPLNKIRLILPHYADKSWTRIYYGEDAFFTVPLEYDELLEGIKSVCKDEDVYEVEGGESIYVGNI